MAKEETPVNVTGFKITAYDTDTNDMSEHTHYIIPNGNNVFIAVADTNTGKVMLNAKIAGGKGVYNAIARLVGVDPL